MAVRHYFDHAASAPLRPTAWAAMAELASLTGNPHALHGSGRGARRVLEEARESLAADLGCQAPELVFTSGGTEANNLALAGVLAAPRSDPARRRLVISAIEHPSVDAVRVKMAERVDVVAVTPAGQVELASADREVTSATALVSVMAVNNETGVVQPVGELATLARERGALSHSDAIQALGHVPLSFAELGLDLMSVSAHKVGGPVGIGALIVRRGVALAPLGFGGGQERKLRSGTVPVLLAVGFAAASREAVSDLARETARLGRVRERLAGGLAALPGVALNGSGELSPAIVNVTFDGVRADDLLLLLDRAGVDASTGSACSAGVHQPSHVLRAMGRSADACSGSLRFSFGPATSGESVDALLAVLPEALALARAALS